MNVDQLSWTYKRIQNWYVGLDIAEQHSHNMYIGHSYTFKMYYYINMNLFPNLLIFFHGDIGVQPNMQLFIVLVVGTYVRLIRSEDIIQEFLSNIDTSLKIVQEYLQLA